MILAATAAGLTWTLVPRPAPTPIDLSSYRFTPVSLDAATEREPLWSPDGRSLAYLRNVDGVQHVMVREVGAATAVQLTRGPFNAMLPFWAPDGARIYFMRGPAPVSLYSVSAVGGEPERVIDSATSAALHPRDGRFVFARAGQLFLLDPSSGAAAREPVAFGQTSFTGAVIVRGFSPDGRVLAVVHDATLRMLEYPSGTARTTTIANIPPGGLLGWMPDSRRFVTEKLQDSIGEGLAMVDAETGVSRTILSSPMALLNPRVSPDGTRLAFATGDPRWKLVEVMLADGRLRVLESDNRFSAFPSLSPDGTRLAFVNGSGASNAAIREMALSATGDVVAKTITAIDGEMIEHVQWSPDGARVLFTAVALNGSRVMVAPAGGGRALAVDPGARLSRGGVWSPDGAQIAYRRQLGDEHQLVTVRVGTSAAPVVLRRWTARDPLRLPLAWSPDGRWILTRQGLSLALLASDGSSERQLFSTAGSTERARPMFTRDGREVLLLRRDVAAPEGPWRLFATDIASGTERVLTTVDFPSTAEDVAGLSLSPDGTRLYTSFADWPFDIWMLEGFQ